jgi:hypothetical protein
VTPAEAIEFVKAHGVVLESASGPAPALAAAIAGGAIKGTWWSHPQGREIYALTRAVRDCPDVLVCRLVEGKITYVHRRLWAALVRVSKRFPAAHFARVGEEHTSSGKHVSEETLFPAWVSKETTDRASQLEEQSALDALGRAVR